MKQIIAIVTALITLFLTACEPIGTPEKTEAPTTITTTTAAAPVVTVYGESFEAVPKSVVCLSPALVEMIYEEKAEAYLVGVGQYCDYPETAMIDHPVCGSAANPDFEAIKALSPELLLTQSPIATKDLTALHAAGVRVLVIPAVKTVSDIQTLYDSLAELFEVPTVTLPELMMMPLLSSWRMGDFVYYLSDDLTAAGDDTFAGNFFSGYGTNLCEGKSEEIPDPDRAETIILPAYLEHLAESFSIVTEEETETIPPHIIVLSEESSKLLERPTSRVQDVLSEVTEKWMTTQ
ncbi:MAG: helical backbone metal receptor [Ruminococcus sp.]|jgi:iron complex transport system substrate-binding protein|nr:helical backbone metal receptor [Ruminococcus sp.]